MKALISGIKSIVNAIVSAFKFLGLLIDGILDLVQMLPEGIEMLVDSLAALPSSIVAFASAGITISVIFIMVGRSKTN